MIKLLRQGFLFFLLFVFGAASQAQQDTLVQSRAQCEAVFLAKNLTLLAEKFEIPKAEAQLLQAKLWPNPAFSLDQINLWATKSQTGGETVIPSLAFLPANRNFSAALEQMVLTAGKRKKAIALEQVSVEKSKQNFDELLRNLKSEFRRQLTDLQYLQLSKKNYEIQLYSLQQLLMAYQRQLDAGNVTKGEFIRLKAQELEFSKMINDFTQNIHERENGLKELMYLPVNTFLVIEDEDFYKFDHSFSSLSFSSVLDTAKACRPDLKLAYLEQQYFENLYAVEKAQKVPNLTIKGAYDRGGGPMLNFVSFGVAMDLPLFNRNQGNIKTAQAGVEQSKILVLQKKHSLENDIALSYQNLMVSLQFYNSIATGYEQTLDKLLNAYTKNFSGKNISLVEYLDFLNAYLDNKKIILDGAKDVHEKIEALNYVVGKDIL